MIPESFSGLTLLVYVFLSMSIAAKMTLGASFAVSASIIWYVHYKQKTDLEQLHDGVLRDIERQRMRQIQNLQTLQQQIDLTKQLKEQERQMQAEEE